jgi:copper transport protein
MKKHSFFLLIVVLLYCAWAVSPAYAHTLLVASRPSAAAHAVFVRSSPAPNAVLTQSPAQVEIYFSETLQDGLSSISVYASSGSQVDVGDVRVDSANPARMTVSLHRLEDGVYTVSWKVVSAIDGHFTTGSFPFALGDANRSALTPIQQSSSATLPFSALIAKWLLLAALAVLVGQAPFIAFIWNPTLKHQADLAPDVYQPPIWRKISQFAWMAFLFGLALNLLSQAGQASGNELAWPWASQTGVVLTGSRLGLIWLTRLALAVIGIWLTRGRFVPWKRWAEFAASLTLLLTISLVSHAATEPRPFLPVLADWLHLVGMSFWFGGLVYLFSGLRKFHQVEGALRTRLIAISIARFSVMALVSVGVIGVTGLYAAALRVGSFTLLDTTLYGHVLYIKQGFVAALLMLAAVNLLFISPRLKRDRQVGLSNIPLVTHFEDMVKGEIILACILLITVSLLTYLPPAKSVQPVAELTDTFIADDLQMDITISPGIVGQNVFTLKLTSNGQPVQTVKEALLRFTAGQGNLPPSEVQLISQGDGSYVTKGSYLSLPGNWQVQAVVRRADVFDAYANFNFTVNNPGADNQGAATPMFAAWLMLLNGLLFGAFMFFNTRKPTLRFGAGLLPGLLFVSIGVLTLISPPPVATSQANPILPDAKSINAGQALFSNYCVPCHGVFGKGDGPLGLTLNPRPANLSYHAIPGVHTDAQLFEWITNGFPGSRMPAFKVSLSDTDRWNLVNFIRTLAPK